VTWYPNAGGHYELYDGIIVEMPKPTGKHSHVTGFLIEELILTIVGMVKRGIWTIPRESIVKSKNARSGYEPDIIVLDQEAIADEPRWQSESIVENARSVKLIVEDDKNEVLYYIKKLKILQLNNQPLWKRSKIY